MSRPSLETARLMLHPAVPQDLPRLHAIWSEPAVRRFLFDDREVSLELAGSVLDPRCSIIASRRRRRAAVCRSCTSRTAERCGSATNLAHFLGGGRMGFSGRRLLLCRVQERLHHEITPLAPPGRGDGPAPRRDPHQCRVAVQERTDYARATADLADDALKRAICSDLPPGCRGRHGSSASIGRSCATGSSTRVAWMRVI